MRQPISALLCLLPLLACASEPSDYEGFQTEWEDRASRVDTLSFELRPGATLDLLGTNGDVHVVEGDGAHARLEAKVEVFALTQAEADVGLAGCRLNLSRYGEDAVVRLQSDLPGTAGARRAWTSVSYQVTLPRHGRVLVETDLGDVVVAGRFAACRTATDHGRVEVSGLRGDVVARSDSGDVSVRDCRGGAISVTANAGRVELSNLDVESVAAAVFSGATAIEDVHVAGAIEVATNTQGSIYLTRVSGDIRAHTVSGDIVLKQAQPAATKLVAGYGSVTIEQAAGQFEVLTTSGAIRVSDFEGELLVDSGYGHVELSGLFLALDARIGTGDLTVQALEGSRLAAPWRLRSAYGHVRLSAPADFSCQLEARSGKGEIRCEFPIDVEAGSLSGDNMLRGTIGAGGELLTVESSTGDIQLTGPQAP